jgi:hypothetical protein
MKLEHNSDNVVIFSSSAAKPNIVIQPPAKRDHKESHSGWSISINNPEDIIHQFSQLKMKKEFKLSAYQYQDGFGNGNGVVWAIPHDRELKSMDDNSELPLKPAFAEDDFMVAIEGDQSPLSYLQAAIVWHELHEFGAMWHGCSWSEDQILPITDDFQDDVLALYDQEPDGNPLDEVSIEDYLFFLHPWTKLKQIPEILHPHFYYKNNHPIIVFYTINDIGYYKLRRFTHTFAQSGYVQNVEVEELGIGDAGKIF